MSKQIQEAYIVAATRTPVAKRNGMFRNVRPDDMLAHVLAAVVAKVPGLDAHDIADVIVGCAMPEAEQGMNVARIGLLLAGLPCSVPGITINRFCSSGLQAVADAAARIRLGEADVMIAAGTESMSVMPQIMGNKISLNPAIFAKEENLGIAFGMGLTAEKVAQQWQVSRDEQDAFAVQSNQRAAAAIAAGAFRDEITPYTVRTHVPGAGGMTHDLRDRLVRQGQAFPAVTGRHNPGDGRSVEPQVRQDGVKGLPAGAFGIVARENDPAGEDFSALHDDGLGADGPDVNSC